MSWICLRTWSKAKHLIEEHEAGIRDAQIVLRQLGQTFDLAHHVVGKEPDRARGKRRQPSYMRRLLPGQQVLQKRKDVPLQGAGLASLVDGNRASAGQDGAIGPDADKGIATHFFAAFHGFEEKGSAVHRRRGAKRRIPGFRGRP